MKKQKLITLSTLVLLALLIVTVPAWATIIDIDLTLSTGNVSGFKIDGSTQEWIDVDTARYDYDEASQNVTGATDGFRLASISEWWVIANELLIGGYSLAEHEIIGGTYTEDNVRYAAGLVIPEGGLGNGVVGYWNPDSNAWISDSYLLTNTRAWLVRDTAPVPEPTTMLLLGTGLVGVAGAARRRKKNQA